MKPVRLDILSVGDATVDVFLKLHDATLQCSLDRRSCLFCLRYADKIPVEELTRVPAAGNAANHAVGSARLGLDVALVTTLGRDEAGRQILSTLRQNRVDTRYVTSDRNHGTNYSTILSYRGERTILVYHEPRTYRFPQLGSPTSRFAIRRGGVPGLARARWVYLTSMGRGWERIVPALLRYLRTASAHLAFNPGTHQLRSRSSVLRNLLAHTDLLLVNREEASQLLRRRGSPRVPETLRRLRERGPRTVLVTDGPRGAYALSEERAWFMPPYPARAVERTGAGDAFGAGFLAACLLGKKVPEALRWGTVNAGSVIQFVGPQAGLLTEAGMRALLRRHPGLVARLL